MIIIMIDDNPTVLVTNSQLLKKSGAVEQRDTVKMFKSPEEFWEDFKNSKANSYDVVICDHDLGSNKINGYELITEAQKSGFHGVAILLTGDDSEAMEMRMDLTIGIEYVVKNIKEDEEGTIPVLTKLINKEREEKRIFSKSHQ